MTDEGPKIIIDEDWKAQVQREKEAAQQAAQSGETPTPAEDSAQGEPERASFENLVSGLAMQVMIALGIMAPRGAKEVIVDLVEAKYLIDLLMLLRDKTKGNLTLKEQGFLTETLAELQNGFVVRSQQVHENALRGSGINPPAHG
jgi:hypothetical protein